ncbi:MAG: penicillin-binding protein 2 [Campylobacterota bacterium]|nr:penicillin-binding protein 2 [Campylobacterota bacterium]
MKYKIIFLLLFIIWGIMIVRLYQISIKSTYYYQELAKENIERKHYLKPLRGEIIDISGKLLAMNRIGFSISITPHLKKGGERLNQVVDNLIDTFPDLNKTIMLKVYKKASSAYNHKYIKVIDFVRYRDMMHAYPVLSLDEDIKIEAETKRYYPYGKYAAHIVGYTGRSNEKENDKDFVVDQVGVVGKAGLEYYYNKTLQGELGHTITKVTATNQEVDVLKYEKPIENQNLVLNLDMDMQMMIYKRMKKMAGVVIVMRTNGEIIAAVSAPTYDPNMFVGGISKKNWNILQEDPEHPFTNRLVHGTYPPGSTIKMGVAIADSLSPKGNIDANERCSGWITIGKSRHKFRCWKKHGHGKVNLRKAIRESCDVFFYNKSLEIGIDFMSKTLKSLGLGIKTGVDLPREYNGIIPDKAWKMKRFKQPWYMGETVIASIGQGYDSVTPMQLARYTNLLATGNLVTPRFAKVINGTPVTPEIKHVALNPDLMKRIHAGMYDVCNTPHGTAYKHLRDLPITVAGKTGTSQVVAIAQNVVDRQKEHSMEYWQRSHALLTTYAPFKDPKYIVTTLVEHGGHGGGTNGPVVADIYRWMYAKGYFAKDTNTTAAKLLNMDRNESETLPPI